MRPQVIWTILTMLLSRCNNVNQVYALRFFVGKNADLKDLGRKIPVVYPDSRSCGKHLLPWHTVHDRIVVPS